MALSMTNNHGIVEIKGNITGKSALNIQHHFEQLLAKGERIIMSLDHVKKIDASGVNILTRLHKKAMQLNTILCIIGQENQKVLEAFGSTSYVLQRDFV